MKFHKDRLKVCNNAVRNITYTAYTEPEAAYDVRDLLTMASEGKPLPSLKSYQFMDNKMIDLTVPTDNIDDICSAVAVGNKQKAYDSQKEIWEKEREEDIAKKAKDKEKQAIIAEYEASLNSSNN